MEENKMDTQDTQPSAITQPEENGNQAAERMFTQDEVNDIVRDRLARAHKEDQGWELFVKKAGSLHKQEEDIKKHEFFIKHNLNPDFIDLIAGDSYGKWENNAKTLQAMIIDEARQMIREKDERMKDSADASTPAPSKTLRKIFGLGKKE